MTTPVRVPSDLSPEGTRTFRERRLHLREDVTALRDACRFRLPIAGRFDDEVSISLGGRAVDAIRRISKGADPAAFLVVGAALALVLRRYTGGRTVALEVPRPAGSSSAEGPPPGTVPLIFSFDGLDTFKDLLIAFRQTLSQTWHDRTAGIHVSSGDERPDVLAAPSSMPGAVPQPHHSLCLTIDLDGGSGSGITLTLASPSGVLPGWFLADLGATLDDLLATFNDLEQPLASIEGIVRARANARTATFDHNPKPAFLGTTVLDLFDRQVRAQPAATALVCGETSLSYGELDERASRLATRLRRSFGIRSGHAVAALCSRSHWAVVSLLAILKAGAVYLPLNPQTPQRELRRILAESGARAAVTQSSRRELWAGLGDLPRLVVDEPTAHEAAPDGAELRQAPPTPEDAAYAIYTSGTTGVPKGVLLAHGGLANTVLDHIEQFCVTPSDRYLQFMALSFDGFLLDAFTALCAGAALIIANETAINDPARLADVVAAHGATLSTITPSYLQLMDPEKLASLRVLVSAGEAIDAKLAGRLATRLTLYNGYGPTEATINSTLHRIDPAACLATIPIGRPGANKRIHVLDRHLELQPVGVVGEICIAGAGLALGYVGDPNLTREKFVVPPFPGGSRLYRTGDLGAWTEDGELLFVGRADSQVKVNGYRIDLRQIEAALEAHPAVRSSHVRIPDAEARHREIWAFYQASPAQFPSGEALQQHLIDTLPAYMRPHRLIEVTDWPLTPHGKTDGRRLMELAAARPDAPRGPHAPPSSPLQRTLCAVWGKVLNRSGIGIDDEFFSLGGDSIRVIQTVHEIRRHGIAMEARDVLDHPTVRRLAEYVERQRYRAEVPADVPPVPAPLSAAERAVLPSGIEDAYPAALMQSYMIRAYDADRTGAGIYLGCAEWRFEDPSLSEDALVEAIRRLHRDHRSLRTSFLASPDGRDLLLVNAAQAPEIRRSDLRGLAPDRRDAWFRDEISRETARRFAPYARTPLIRFHLCRTGHTSCSLFVSFHHALLDGWSGVELRNALYDHYVAARAGTPPPAPASSLDSYKEFVALEQAALGNTPARRFWRSELARKEVRALLDALRDRAADDCGNGPRATRDAVFPADLAEAAIRYTQAHGTSLKALFLSAVLRSLAEAAGTTGLAVAVVTNGRSPRLSEPFRSTGLFWNIVPFIGSTGTASSVRHVQDKLNEIEPFGHFPWKAIEEEIAGRKLPIPLFNFVNFHNAGAGARRFAEGAVQSRFHFPLTFFVKFAGTAGTASAAMRLEFDRAVIDEVAMERIVELVRKNTTATVMGAS